MGQAITENDAGTKWCPQTRIHVKEEVHQGLRQVVAVNRLPKSKDPFAGARCVGSLCAHWQWLAGQRGSDKKGFCGLSGVPKA